MLEKWTYNDHTWLLTKDEAETLIREIGNTAWGGYTDIHDLRMTRQFPYSFSGELAVSFLAVAPEDTWPALEEIKHSVAIDRSISFSHRGQVFVSCSVGLSRTELPWYQSPSSQLISPATPERKPFDAQGLVNQALQGNKDFREKYLQSKRPDQ